MWFWDWNDELDRNLTWRSWATVGLMYVYNAISSKSFEEGLAYACSVKGVVEFISMWMQKG